MGPRYFTLQASFMEPRGADGGGRMVPAGTVVEFDGAPGASLLPLCPAARAARRAVLKGRNADQRARDAMWIARWRRGFSGTKLRVIDHAIADMEAGHG